MGHDEHVCALKASVFQYTLVTAVSAKHRLTSKAGLLDDSRVQLKAQEWYSFFLQEWYSFFLQECTGDLPGPAVFEPRATPTVR
ncbi:hypothetical protein [Marinobacter sp.]|uniref:hypothetical protein n=1 Tax=Marinobacter sp. TaxID=50741 RepID=UPI003A8F4CAC